MIGFGKVYKVYPQLEYWSWSCELDPERNNRTTLFQAPVPKSKTEASFVVASKTNHVHIENPVLALIAPKLRGFSLKY